MRLASFGNTCLVLLLAVTFAPVARADHAGDTSGTPDLVVDQKFLQNHWIVRDEDFGGADDCAAVEGGISAGTHRVLRFSVSTPNIGTGDLALGDPNVHFANNDGLYEFAQCPLRVGLDLGALDDDPEDGRVHRDAPPKI